MASSAGSPALRRKGINLISTQFQYRVDIKRISQMIWSIFYELQMLQIQFLFFSVAQNIQFFVHIILIQGMRERCIMMAIKFKFHLFLCYHFTIDSLAAIRRHHLKTHYEWYWKSIKICFAILCFPPSGMCNIIYVLRKRLHSMGQKNLMMIVIWKWDTYRYREYKWKGMMMRQNVWKCFDGHLIHFDPHFIVS